MGCFNFLSGHVRRLSLESPTGFYLKRRVDDCGLPRGGCETHRLTASAFAPPDCGKPDIHPILTSQTDNSDSMRNSATDCETFSVQASLVGTPKRTTIQSRWILMANDQRCRESTQSVVDSETEPRQKPRSVLKRSPHRRNRAGDSRTGFERKLTANGYRFVSWWREPSFKLSDGPKRRRE